MGYTTFGHTILRNTKLYKLGSWRNFLNLALRDCFSSYIPWFINPESCLLDLPWKITTKEDIFDVMNGLTKDSNERKEEIELK